MFSFRLFPKDAFEQSVFDIISILFIVHVGCVLFLFFIKWVNFFLKNFVEKMVRKKTLIDQHSQNVIANSKEDDSNDTFLTKSKGHDDNPAENLISRSSESILSENINHSKLNEDLDKNVTSKEKENNLCKNASSKAKEHDSEENIKAKSKEYLYENEISTSNENVTLREKENGLYENASLKAREHDSEENIKSKSKERDENNSTKQSVLAINRQFFDEIESSSSSDELFNKYEGLKSILNVIDDPVFSYEKEIFHAQSFGGDNTDRKFLGQFSSEAQTIITIDPKLFLDDFSPDVMFIKLFPNTSAYGKTATSDVSFMADAVEHQNSPIGNQHLDIQHIEDHDKLQQQEMSNKISDVIESGKLQTDKENNLIFDVDENLTQENKLLEVAIQDFKDELQPIKDQIQALKKSLNMFENTLSNHNVSSSISLSSTDTFWCSDTSSLMTCVSSHNTLLEKISMPYEYLVQMERNEIFSKDTNGRPMSNIDTVIDTKYKSLTDDEYKYNVRRSRQSYKPLKKLSPISEMYIKLAQSKSQASYQISNKKHSCIRQYVSGNRVTCHINLNVNVSAVSASNGHRRSLVNEPTTMSPIFLDPEDIFN